MTRVLRAVFIILFSIIAISFSQNKPYPQGVNFTGCIKPNNVTQADMNNEVAAYYNTWKSRYLKQSTKTPGGYYIESGGTGGSWNKTTISEVHGWGMIVAALMAGHDSNAKTVFDGMFKFFNDHRSSENNNLMSWQVLGNESDSADASATDGDLDIAYSLILAHDQWGSTGAIKYIQEARKIIVNGIRVSDINPDTKRLMLGDFADNDIPTSEYYWATRPSDWMANHLRAYKFITGVSLFEEVANNIYTLYTAFSGTYSNSTGLVSDFIVSNPPQPAPKNYLWEYVNTDSYSYNACRFPWRIAMDYAHYGNASAKAICNKILNWLKPATSNSPSGICAGYRLDGSAITGPDGGAAFIAPFVAACVVDASHQAYLNAGWYELNENWAGNVYHHSINLLSMLFISGNWWKAEGEEYIPDTGGVILDDFDNAYGDTPLQTYLGAAYGCSNWEWKHMDSGGGWWFIYTDDSGSVLESDGTVLDSINYAGMIRNKELHVTMKTTTSTAIESYAGIGCSILLDGQTYYDFSRIRGITVRAKGTGVVRVSLLSKDILELPNVGDRWGFYGFDITLEPNYKDFTVDTSLFQPQQYSYAYTNKWTWHHGKTEVRELEISVPEAGKDADVYIDKIVLTGMNYKTDFGFDYIHPDHIDIHTEKAGNLLFRSGLMVKKVAQKSITFNYFLVENSTVRLGIYTIKGILVKVLVNDYKKKGTYTDTFDLQSAGVSNGIYLIRLVTDHVAEARKFSVIR
jgi:endo-1,4-beta-D-glucanase Y